MPMQLVEQSISSAELTELAKERFGDLVKAVVDIERGLMVIGGELHADEERELLGQGSKQQDLWGINIYPDKVGDDFIEFDSMINLRPSRGNRSRGVENVETQSKIREIVKKLVST